MHTKLKFRNIIRNLFLFLFLTSAIEIAFWAIYYQAFGHVPKGWGGLSRFWDVAIQPVWVVGVVILMGILLESDALAIISLWVWVLGGLCSFFFGFAFLLPAVGAVVASWILIAAFGFLASFFSKASAA